MLRNLTCLLALLAVVAGCGSEDDDSSGSATTTAIQETEPSQPSQAGTAPEEPNDAKSRLTKDQYERRVTAAFDETTQTNEAAADQEGPQRLRTASGALGKLVTILEDLRPPQEVERAHSDFTEGIRATTSLLRRATKALENGDNARAERLLKLQNRLPQDLQRRVRRARQTFERLNYNLPIEAPGT